MKYQVSAQRLTFLYVHVFTHIKKKISLATLIHASITNIKKFKIPFSLRYIIHIHIYTHIHSVTPNSLSLLLKGW